MKNSVLIPLCCHQCGKVTPWCDQEEEIVRARLQNRASYSNSNRFFSASSGLEDKSFSSNLSPLIEKKAVRVRRRRRLFGFLVSVRLRPRTAAFVDCFPPQLIESSGTESASCRFTLVDAGLFLK